ncbi:MAG: ArsR/SmtB family transcription factor [Candidatus Goldiibacteriota bacterium]
MEKALKIFASLADKTRLRLYRLLLKTDKEIAVCELIDAVKESQYNVSRHLQILKNAGMVKEKRNGRWILYSAAADPDVNLSDAVVKMDETVLKKDFERLEKRLSLRRNGEIISCRIAGNNKKRGEKNG